MPIECENISFKYWTKLVLDDISLQFGKGHLYGILGPNGSGKTTLLKVLCGILKSKYGQVVVDEFNIKKMNISDVAKKIAVVEQSTSIDFDYSVREIVKMGRFTHIGRFSKETSEEKKIVNEILEQFNLSELENRGYNTLSGGEQQKVIIARAIAQQSKILLLDEPTTHLDLNYQIEFMEILRKYINDGIIVIIIIHDVNLATQFCDKIVLLKEGRVIAFGNREEIITRKNLKLIYNIDVVVRKNPFSNSIYIIPHKIEFPTSMRYDNNFKIKKIHVIAGGGAASKILPKLNDYDVSVGIVNVLDDDYILANELNYRIISEAPFSPITNDSSEELKTILKNVDLIILANIPFGITNLKNLEILNESNKKIVLFERNPIEDRDFTEGIATTIYNNLKSKSNVKTTNNLHDLFKFIESMEE